ncbi:MAG: MarR family winged helix-turn-helix transcriptional regulator [Rectinemataceae bacterium]
MEPDLYAEILEKTIRLTNAVREASKTVSDYGTGRPIHSSEAHLLDAIHNHEDSNSSDLARALGVTNGAVTQAAAKLLGKKLIERYQLDGDRKAVFYRPTPLGNAARKQHNREREVRYRMVRSYLEGLARTELHVIVNFLDELNRIWPDFEG